MYSQIFMRVGFSWEFRSHFGTQMRARLCQELGALQNRNCEELSYFENSSSCCVGWEYEILVLSSLKAWPYLTNSIISKNPKCRKLQFLLQCPLSCWKLTLFVHFKNFAFPLLPPGPSLPPGAALTFPTHPSSGRKGYFSSPGLIAKLPHYWHY